MPKPLRVSVMAAVLKLYIQDKLTFSRENHSAIRRVAGIRPRKPQNHKKGNLAA